MRFKNISFIVYVGAHVIWLYVFTAEGAICPLQYFWKYFLKSEGGQGYFRDPWMAANFCVKWLNFASWNVIWISTVSRDCR